MNIVPKVLMGLVTSVWVIALALFGFSTFSYFFLDNQSAKAIMQLTAIPGFAGLLAYLVSSKFQDLTNESLPFTSAGLWP
ncbi:MAG TPA: hypothetical protein VGB97_03370 [Candidatus Paceibacterota bacterium]|jgi:hypothetical protein